MDTSKLSSSIPDTNHASQGFTLLEVMIAVAVLAVTLTVLFGSQSQSLSLAAEAKFNTNATFLAGLKMAEIESGVAELVNDEGDFGEQYPDFLWRVEIEDTVLSEPEFFEDLSDTLRRVTLTILWADSPYSHSIDFYMQERSSEN